MPLCNLLEENIMPHALQYPKMLQTMAIVLQTLLILRPLEVIIHQVYRNGYTNRSSLYVNMICLIACTAPCLVCQASLRTDFSDMLFIGMALHTIKCLLSPEGGIVNAI